MNFLEIRTLVGVMIDDVNFGYQTVPNVNVNINNALYEVQRRILKTRQAYYHKCIFTTLVIGQREYVLPDDFLCMYDLWVILDGTAPNEQTLPLDYIAPSRRHDFLPQNGTPTNFWLKKNNIVLATPPDQTLTLEMIYAPLVDQLVLDADIPDVPVQFHELIALYAIRSCYMRDDKVNTLVTEKIKEFEAGITENEQRIENASRYFIMVE